MVNLKSIRPVYLISVTIVATGVVWFAFHRAERQAVPQNATKNSQTHPYSQHSKTNFAAKTGHGPQQVLTDLSVSADSNVQQLSDNFRFPDTSIGRIVAAHLLLATTLGPSANENYLRSLDKLREQSEEVLATCVEAYEMAPESDYNFRELLVETISELRTPEALPVLESIALSAIPTEKGDLHGVSTVILETSMRMAAAEGLGRLSTQGVDGATSALLKLATSTESVTVRREAIRAYLSSGNYDERDAKLRDVLPVADHVLITLRTDSLDEISKISK
jgi:hypothetical protein